MVEGWFTSEEAGRVLGVTPARVRALTRSGALAYRMVGHTLLIEPASVHRRRATSQRPRRPLTPTSAWAALLSDLGTNNWVEVTKSLGLSAQQRYSLKRLIARTPSEGWASLARSRATVYRYHVRPAYLDELLNWGGVVRSGVSATRAFHLDLIASDEAEIYLAEDTRRSLQEEFQLKARESGNLVMRIPTVSLPIVLNRPTMPLAVVCVDLLDSGEPRSQRTALQALEQLAHHEDADPID